MRWLINFIVMVRKLSNLRMAYGIPFGVILAEIAVGLLVILILLMNTTHYSPVETQNG